MKPLYIVDRMADVVSKVNSVLLPQLQAYDPNIVAINYQYGHPSEIINTLTTWNESNTFEPKKYPLVALFQDFNEIIKPQVGIYAEVNLHMIIARRTQNTYKAVERYENNFKPVLYPVYLELMNQINLASVFMTNGATNIQHTKIDRLFWGNEGLLGNTANVFNDWIDCIEIKNLQLKVYDNFC